MVIDCPHCHDTTVIRIRRHGIFDHIRSCLGSWPYRCRVCGEWFYAGLRHISRYKSRDTRQTTAGQVLPGPQMAYWSDLSGAAAKIMIRTDSESQLNEILSALTHAVESCRKRSHQHANTGG
jgi:hypothetical protein